MAKIDRLVGHREMPYYFRSVQGCRFCGLPWWVPCSHCFVSMNKICADLHSAHNRKCQANCVFELQNAIQIRKGVQVAAPIKGLGAYFMQVQSFLKLRVRIVNCSPDFQKNVAYSNNGFKRKTGIKQRPFSGHETGAKNVKADSRPSHFWLRFCVRQAAAFL